MDSNNTSATRQLGSLFVDGVYVAGGVQGLGLENLEQIEFIKGL